MYLQQRWAIYIKVRIRLECSRVSGQNVDELSLVKVQDDSVAMICGCYVTQKHKKIYDNLYVISVVVAGISKNNDDAARKQ